MTLECGEEFARARLHRLQLQIELVEAHEHFVRIPSFDTFELLENKFQNKRKSSLLLLSVLHALVGYVGLDEKQTSVAFDILDAQYERASHLELAHGQTMQRISEPLLIALLQHVDSLREPNVHVLVLALPRGYYILVDKNLPKERYICNKSKGLTPQFEQVVMIQIASNHAHQSHLGQVLILVH